MFKLQYGELSFESLNDEILDTSDLSSNRKRKDKEIIEPVKTGKERKWSNAEVDRSSAIFLANQYGAGLFS